ncbi:MAG: hypothetical protein VCF07_18840, partial [Nitrospinota bacterium]
HSPSLEDPVNIPSEYPTLEKKMAGDKDAGGKRPTKKQQKKMSGKKCPGSQPGWPAITGIPL